MNCAHIAGSSKGRTSLSESENFGSIPSPAANMSKPKIEKIVYFVRHGQSVGNVTKAFQAPDSPLNEKGMEQAQRIAERIAKLSFDALIVSPFPRTRQTAEAITRATQKNPEYCDLFVERLKPTSINGKPYTDEEASKKWDEWHSSLYDENLRVEDGENFTDLVNRADNALDFLAQRSESNIVVVTHGYFLRTIIARVLLGESLTGNSFKHFQKHTEHENAGLTVLYYERDGDETKWRLWIYNDHAHLG